MNRRIRLFITPGLVAGLLVVLLVWRVTREGEFMPLSPLVLPPTKPSLPPPSPLSPPVATPRSPAPRPSPPGSDSPLPLPPTGTPPVNTATLAAIRAARPTATSPSPSGIHLPYISPATWRRWALWIFAAAGALAYIGLRLRRSQ